MAGIALSYVAVTEAEPILPPCISKDTIYDLATPEAVTTISPVMTLPFTVSAPVEESYI